MDKSPDAFRTISEVADWLDTPAHVLRFWESRFSQVKPVKRAGGRRYYRPADMALLGGIKKLLHEDGLTIRGVQKLLREHGVKHVAAMSPEIEGIAPVGTDAAHTPETDSQETTRERIPQAPMAENVPVGAFDNDPSQENAEKDKVVPFARAERPSVSAQPARAPEQPVQTPAPEATVEAPEDTLEADLESLPKVPSMSDVPPVDSFGKDKPESEKAATADAPAPEGKKVEDAPTPAAEQPMFDFDAVTREAATEQAPKEVQERAPADTEPTIEASIAAALEETHEESEAPQDVAQEPIEPTRTAQQGEDAPKDAPEATKEAEPHKASPAPAKENELAKATASIPVDPADDAQGLDVPRGVVGRLDRSALSAMDAQELRAIASRAKALLDRLSGSA